MTRRPPGPYRDGLVHVLAQRCNTCVFRAGNLMHLRAGRLKDLVAANVQADSALTCHETLNTDVPAVCRGFYDTHPTMPLRMATVMQLVVFQDPPDVSDYD